MVEVCHCRICRMAGVNKSCKYCNFAGEVLSKSENFASCQLYVSKCEKGDLKDADQIQLVFIEWQHRTPGACLLQVPKRLAIPLRWPCPSGADHGMAMAPKFGWFSRRQQWLIDALSHSCGYDDSRGWVQVDFNLGVDIIIALLTW